MPAQESSGLFMGVLGTSDFPSANRLAKALTTGDCLSLSRRGICATARATATMIKVCRVPISKKQISTLPQDERVLLLLMGHALNQISVFLKLFTFSSNKDPAHPIEGRVSAAQSHIILRVLFGVLLEAWNVICTNKPIIDRYMPEIDDDGQQSYKTLEEYFQKSSLLYKLRNNFAYHLPNTKVVEKAFNSIPENEDWEWYLSPHNANSFYFSCELIMGYGVLNLARNKASPDAALGEVIKEVRHVANTMPYFLMPFIRAILFRHFGESILDTLPGVTISDAPSLFEFWIPFFAEWPEPAS
jgi:hypothetical protein